MILIRQSTAFETAIGPVLDADGVAVTDGVVGDFKIKKTTGDFAALNGSATLTHVSAGMYDIVLTTSDTDTVGVCCVAIDDTTNACAPLYLQVMEEAAYDAMFAAAAPGYVANAPVNVAQISGDGTAADTLELFAEALDQATGQVDAGTFAAGAIDAAAIADGAIDRATFAADTGLQSVHSGTAQGGALQAITLDTGASTSNNFYKSMRIYLTGGTGAGQDSIITTYTGATRTAVVHDVWTVQPDNTTKFSIWPNAKVDVHMVDGATLNSATAQFGVNVVTINGQTVTAAGAITAGAYIGGTGAAALEATAQSILDDTGTAGVVVAAGSKTGYSLTAGTGLGNQTADITGNLSGSVGSVTGGINTGSGTITTLDGLDTAQDTQHSTTQGRLPSSAQAAKLGRLYDGWIEADADDTNHAPTTTTVEVIDASGAGRADKWLYGVVQISQATDSENLGYVTRITNAEEVNDGYTLLTLEPALPAALTSGDKVVRISSWGPSIDVETDCATALAAYDGPTRAEATADKDEILAQLPAAPVKNATFTYVIKMVDSTDHVTPKTGLTVTMTRSIDGAAFGAATGSVAEISTGHYKVDASAADMNGDVVTHRFAATGADDLTVEFKTVS